MQVKVLKTENAYTVSCVSELTKEMLERVPEETRVLRDEKGNPIYKIEYGKEVEFGKYGATVPGKTFSFSLDVKLASEDFLKYRLAETKERFTEVEKAVVAKYNAMAEEASKIEIVDLADLMNPTVVEGE